MNTKFVLPNFVVIGASKSGSTSLYRYLRQHPEIFMSPIKEPGYFLMGPDVLDGLVEEDRKLLERRRKHRRYGLLENYLELFNGVRSEIAIGEATNQYLQDPWAPSAIKTCIPEARLIAILRNPIDRMRSHFMWRARNGNTKANTFCDFVKSEVAYDRYLSEQGAIRSSPLRAGMYYANLSRYINLFSLNNIKIVYYDDFVSDTIMVMQDIYDFLNVDKNFVPDVSTRHQESGVPRYRWVSRLFGRRSMSKSWIKKMMPTVLIEGIRERRSNYLERVEITKEARSILVDVYRDDVCNLSGLMGCDLSDWLR